MERAGLDWTELFTDTLVLVARPDHPLAGRGPVTLDDLCGQDYVGREPGSGTRKVIGALLEAGRRETDLRRVALFGGNEAVREAVKAGVGLSMLSRRSVAADLAAGALVEIPWLVFPASGLLPAAPQEPAAALGRGPGRASARRHPRRGFVPRPETKIPLPPASPAHSEPFASCPPADRPPCPDAPRGRPAWRTPAIAIEFSYLNRFNIEITYLTYRFLSGYVPQPVCAIGTDDAPLVRPFQGG